MSSCKSEDMQNDDLYSVSHAVRRQANAQGEATVFTFENKRTSFSELDRKSNQTARALIAAGIKKGDRVGVLSKNSPIYFEIIAAAAKMGAVVNSVNWRLAADEIRYVFDDSGSKLIFVGAEFLDIVGEVLPTLKVKAPVYDIEGAGDKYPHFETWRDEFSEAPLDIETSSDDPIVQLYTSGTTGRPKGAVLSHRSILALRGQDPTYDMADWQKWVPGETGLLAMPCFHVGGTVFGLSMIQSGAHAVVVREYNPNTALDFIEEYGISKIFMVPAALQILLNHPRVEEADFSKLGYIYYGASPIPLSLMRESIRVFGCDFVQMYGMTETSGTIVALPPEDHDPNGSPKMRSVGKPLRGVEIKIIDKDGADVPTGEVGEIATRSVKNMVAYWNKPEATNQTVDADGWLRTGDAGYLDEDGYLYIHDRVKDMIISGGENIYPAEVENAIYSHEDVADVAVIGVPNEKWGEAVMAYVVLKDDRDLSAEDVIEYARSKIARYKCPKTIAFIEALPRNASGKILRKDLRAPHWAGKDRHVN